MKTKIVSISSLLFVLIFTAGCGLLPGSSSTPPSTPVGPINSNYSNAISPAQQLILGTMNLQGNLVVTLDEATQLLPFWEAYKDLSTSNTASPLELQATLLGVEQAMTPAQVQAIVNMKLTESRYGNYITATRSNIWGQRRIGYTPRHRRGRRRIWWRWWRRNSRRHKWWRRRIWQWRHQRRRDSQSASYCNIEGKSLY